MTHRRVAFLLTCAALMTLTFGSTVLAGATDQVPSGQRVFGHTVVEPVYDAEHAGAIGFIGTPEKAPVDSDPSAWSPLFLPVYPAGSTVGALICPHTPVDTCPDHGPGIAGLAQTVMPNVYGAGVLGHDHLTDIHGDDFHVALEPTVVLFTTPAAANQHLLTRAAIEAAIDRGDAIAIALGFALHGEPVPINVWTRATPVA